MRPEIDLSAAHSGPIVQMSQNYASLICSVASALLVLVAIEVATTLKNMGEENLKLRKLFASEIKESAEAQRSAIEISPPGGTMSTAGSGSTFGCVYAPVACFKSCTFAGSQSSRFAKH